MRLLLAAAIFLLLTGSAGAREAQPSGNPAVIAVARAYLDAYGDLDLGRLGQIYTEQVEFNDPTSLQVQGLGGPFVWHGREAVLAGIGRWTKSIVSLRYDLDRVYESSGRVVFVGTVNPMVRSPGGPVQYRYPIVTIVTVEDGKVVEHRDYVDYAGGGVVSLP